MSSYFNNQSAGVQKPPGVCKSKKAEAAKIWPIDGLAAVIQIDIPAWVVFFGHQIQETYRVTRDNHADAWNTGNQLSAQTLVRVQVNSPTVGFPSIAGVHLTSISGSTVLDVRTLVPELRIPEKISGYDSRNSPLYFQLVFQAGIFRLWIN